MKPQDEDLTVREGGHTIYVVRSEGADDPLRRYSLAMVYSPGPNDDPEVKSYEDGEKIARARAKQFAAAAKAIRLLKTIYDDSIECRYSSSQPNTCMKSGVPRCDRCVAREILRSVEAP